MSTPTCTRRLTGFRDDVLASRDTNPIIQFTYNLGQAFVDIVDWVQRMVSIPDFPRPVPQIGWLGVVAVATWIGLALAGWRSAILVAVSFLAFGQFGYWSDSMDLLIITFVAVGVSVLIGMPLAIWLGTTPRKWVVSTLNTILDIFQTMPTFVYLLPIVLFFGIGASAAVDLHGDLLAASDHPDRRARHPQRLDDHDRGDRLVGPDVAPAAPQGAAPDGPQDHRRGPQPDDHGALAMATIAAFVDGPGLGKPVLAALTRIDVGGAFVPGMLIVLMAVMLDRTTTAASEAAEKRARGGVDQRMRRIVLAVTGVVALVAVYYSRKSLRFAEFPESDWGRTVADWVDRFVNWFTDTFEGATGSFKNFISDVLLNPMQSLLAESPWYVTALAILGLAYVFGGGRAVLPTVVCLAGIWYLDLWHDAMVTLNMTLVGTLLVMVLARGVRRLDGPAPRGWTWCFGRCSTPARPSRRSST